MGGAARAARRATWELCVGMGKGPEAGRGAVGVVKGEGDGDGDGDDAGTPICLCRGDAMPRQGEGAADAGAGDGKGAGAVVPWRKTSCGAGLHARAAMVSPSRCISGGAPGSMGRDGAERRDLVCAVCWSPLYMWGPPVGAKESGS